MRANKFFLYSGFIWYVFILILVLKNMGKVLEAPPMTLFDAVWIPLVIVIFPYWLGAMTFYSKSSGTLLDKKRKE